MYKVEILRQGNQITNQLKDELIRLFQGSEIDDQYKMSKRADTIKSEMEQKFKFRWSIVLYTSDCEISHSFVFAEDFLLELKAEHHFLLAYIIPDQPIQQYEPRRDFGVQRTYYQDRFDPQYLSSQKQFTILSNLLSLNIMNKFLSNSVKRFSVSDDLLLSLSMAHQNQSTYSQVELAQSFVKNKIINPDIADKFAQLDRKFFQDEQNLAPQMLYGNYPIKLTKFDNMTTPIMHVVAANNIYESAKNHNITNISILDIGTGRGYIPFLLRLCFPNAEISGFDINQKLIRQCNELKEKLKNQVFNVESINFRKFNCLVDKLDQKYDYINLGFAIHEEQVKQFSEFANKLLICPLVSEQEQWLTKIDNRGHREKMMKCLFQGGHREELLSKSYLEQEQNEVERQIKQWHQQFVQEFQRKPNIQDMNQDANLQEMLRQRKNLKHELKRC